jgi:D-alanyl-D-alanine dipeptidase
VLSDHFVKLTSLFLFVAVRMVAQGSYNNGNPGLRVLNDRKIFLNMVAKDPGLQMINLKKFLPGIRFDLKYATAENFTGQKLYPPVQTTYLRKEAAEALRAVQQQLHAKGLSLKIFDAYRPYATTVKMWELIHDDRYVADPSKGSGHNRGISVDVTLVDELTGRELNMGTGFDHFSDTAHHSFKALSDQVITNRNLLRELMEKYGFKPLETEWWHYTFISSKSFDVMDFSFRELQRWN